MKRHLLIVLVPLALALLMVGLGLQSERIILTAAGLILVVASLLPLAWVQVPALARRWTQEPRSRFRLMHFLLFRAPLLGLIPVIVGVLLQSPYWIVVGGGLALFCVLSAVHIAVRGQP